MKKILLFVMSIFVCSDFIAAQEIETPKVSKNTVGWRSGLGFNYYVGLTDNDKFTLNNIPSNGQLFINRNLGKKQNWQAELTLTHFMAKSSINYLFCGNSPLIVQDRMVHSFAPSISLRRKFLNINDLNWNHYFGLTTGITYNRFVMTYSETIAQNSPENNYIGYYSSVFTGLDYAGSIGICNRFSVQYLFNLNYFPIRQDYHQKDIGINIGVGVGYKF